MKLKYEKFGKGKKLLILIHGFPGDRRLFSDVGKGLKFDGWVVVIPDLPGYGKSSNDKRTLWKMEEYATLIHDISTSFDPTTLVLGGLSMGGYITMAFEKLYPGKTNAFILANTRDNEDADGGARRAEIVNMLKSGKRDEYLDSFIKLVLADSTLKEQPKLVRKISDIINSASNASMSQSLLGMGQRTESRSILQALDQPILIITGQEDKMTGPEFAEEMFKAYKNAKYKIIPKAGHYSPIENPVEFISSVREFLSELD